MRKILKIVLSIVLCMSMILQGSPAIAKDETDKNEPTYNTKYKVEKIKKPPFIICVSGNEGEDFPESLWYANDKARIGIVGRKEDSEVGGDWKFYVTFLYFFRGETQKIEDLEGSIKIGTAAQLKGSTKAEMTDIAKKKEEEAKEKKKERKLNTPRPAPPKFDATPDEIRKMRQPVKEVYNTEFDVDLQGSIQNLASKTVYGKIGKDDQKYTINGDFMPEDNSIKSKAKVKLSVFSENTVVAYIELEGKSYGPFAGRFTCQEDLDIQRKDSATWPIWGVWTDVSPYERMPDAVKDYSAIQEQIKNNETPKKINYKEGRWVSLKKGKGHDANTYSTLQVSEKDITFEEGEIWAHPGSALFKPTVRTVYSRDMKEELNSSEPMEYTVSLTYNAGSDTISYQSFGMLVRVRNTNLIGVWSSIGEIPMPKLDSSSDIPQGTWYEFKKGGDDSQAQTQRGFSSAYTFTRIISGKDKSVEKDKGTAIMMPIGDEEMVILTGIESEKIKPDGTKTKLVKDDESLSVSDYNKSKGTIKLNLAEYTSLSGSKISGSWSTLNPPVSAPDAANGSFKVRDDTGKVFDPQDNGQWIEFKSTERAFTWTQMIKEPEGILVMNGNFRTFGQDFLLLTNIKGSFYARPGTDVEDFSNEDYMYGERLLQVIQETDDKGKPVSMSISGIGKFLPVK